MVKILEAIRPALLAEARNSPGLLSDLAGLERIVAESYDARSFVELLQNADDAGAARFAILRTGDFLLVANDGHHFTAVEFESLCRSAASTKHRGTSIGYRGIGFKSVVGFAEEVHVLSGELEATFSRERTAREVPQATQVPLIRIPHPLNSAERAQFADVVEALLTDGFKTVFVFGGLIATSIEAEFASFDATSLLFLRNVRQVELRAGVEAVITIRRSTSQPGVRSLRLASAEGVTQWTVLNRDEISFGFVHDETGITRLEEREAVVHAFLPTHEPTGFAFKINGDISTDPSRTRVLLDARTAAGIETAAKFIVQLVRDCLLDAGDVRMLAALIPMSDPRMAGFLRRSFRTELYAALRHVAKGLFENVYCRPPWINALDFETVAGTLNIRMIPRKFEGIEGLASFLKFLGAKEAVFRNIEPALRHITPSSTGAAEIVAHLATLHATGQIEKSALDSGWRVWQVGDKIISLNEAKKEAKPLATEFMNKVAERAASSVELQRLVTAFSDVSTAMLLLPNQESPESSAQTAKLDSNSKVQHLSLKRWRGAEQQVLSLLTAWGWKVEDVSRQNIGYDIEGQTPDGEDAFVEVKVIDHPGQPFILTSNEEAVARQKGNAYRLAIVCQTNDLLEVTFIMDPVNKLKLTRQCRQWVWECANYDYKPQRIALE